MGRWEAAAIQPSHLESQSQLRQDTPGETANGDSERDDPPDWGNFSTKSPPLRIFRIFSILRVRNLGSAGYRWVERGRGGMPFSRTDIL